MYYELVRKNIHADWQLLLPIRYDQLLIQDAYRLDLLIEKKLVIEVKSLERLAPVHYKQVMAYLKLSGLKNGLLINFGEEWVKNGFHRVFNNEGSDASSLSL